MLQKGDYTGARNLVEENLSNPALQKHDQGSGVHLVLLGHIHLELGEPLKTIKEESEAMVRLKKANSNDTALERSCYMFAAQAQAKLGNFKEAADCYRNMVALDIKGELDYEIRQDREMMAMMQEKAGDLLGALKTWEVRLREEHDPRTQGSFHLVMSSLYTKLGDSAAADKFTEEGHRLLNEAAKTHTDEASVSQLYSTASQAAEGGNAKSKYKAFETMLKEARIRGLKNGIAVALGQLAMCDAAAGRQEEGRRKLDEAARAVNGDSDTRGEGYAFAHLGLGLAYCIFGEFTKGFGLMEQAAEIFLKTGDAINETAALRSMRLMCALTGDFTKTLELNARIQAAAQKSGLKRPIVDAENDIGRFYGDIGDSQKAVEHYSLALELARQLGDRELMAVQLNEYGIALMNSGEYDEAIAAFSEAYDKNNWAGTLVNKGEALLFKGELEKAAETLRPINAYHTDMGYYYLLKGQYYNALKSYTPGILTLLFANKEIDLLLARNTGRGLAYEGLKDYANAAYYFLASQKIIERQRDTLSPEHRLHYLGMIDWMQPRLEPYEGMVRISEFLPGGLRDSLYHAEFTRARLFTESAARNYGEPDTRLPPGLSAKERQLNQEVSSAARRAKEANLTADQETFRRLDTEFSVLKKKQDEFTQTLRKEYPEYAAVRYPQPLHVEEFYLQPDEVLIEFEVTRPYTKVFVVKNGKIVLSYNVRLSRDQLSKAVLKYRSFFENVSNKKQLSEFDPKKGNFLYNMLLKPALEAKANGAALVPAGARLLIAPDEILDILPFESLVVTYPAEVSFPSGRFGPAPVGVRYVADSYDVAYAHSATAFSVQRRLKPKAPPQLDLMVLADPVFNASDSRLRGTALAKTRPENGQLKLMGAIDVTMGLSGRRTGLAQTRTIGSDSFTFPRLDKTSLLAYALRDTIFRGRPAEILVGSAASKSELLRRDLTAYRYIVMATHGILDNMVPGLNEPALVLNQIGNAKNDNGFLTMSEVMKLRLNADVVALTACQTGLGRHLTGEGVMGLGRAFQYAGARNVLVSLWSVSEDSTTMLVERFFLHLRDGETPRQALRLAREEVRRAGYEHPFYWAPFILITD